MLSKPRVIEKKAASVRILSDWVSEGDVGDQRHTKEGKRRVSPAWVVLSSLCFVQGLSRLRLRRSDWPEGAVAFAPLPSCGKAESGFLSVPRVVFRHRSRAVSRKVRAFLLSNCDTTSRGTWRWAQLKLARQAITTKLKQIQREAGRVPPCCSARFQALPRP